MASAAGAPARQHLIPGETRQARVTSLDVLVVHSARSQPAFDGLLTNAATCRLMLGGPQPNVVGALGRRAPPGRPAFPKIHSQPPNEHKTRYATFRHLQIGQLGPGLPKSRPT
jgi:hypothetical protein